MGGACGSSSGSQTAMRVVASCTTMAKTLGSLISESEDMEAGRDRAWFGCESDALTPSALGEGWAIVPGEAKGNCTEQAPKVRTRMCE